MKIRNILFSALCVIGIMGCSVGCSIGQAQVKQEVSAEEKKQREVCEIAKQKFEAINVEMMREVPGLKIKATYGKCELLAKPNDDQGYLVAYVDADGPMGKQRAGLMIFFLAANSSWEIVQITPLYQEMTSDQGTSTDDQVRDRVIEL